ncbi:MAG: aminotransferase class V-fold PLP-dependent enzyme [Chloroflexota bacterium]|nr:MAG: aminotransferase class V-fold PLP-dependent enzyme [Chloroflexota bacterium]
MDASLLANLAAGFEKVLKPYGEDFQKFDHLPLQGMDREEILELMEEFKEIEAAQWQDGFLSGVVYHGDTAHIDFMNRVYAINSQSNPIHPEVWPSISKFEAEIVGMTANLMSADQTPDEIVGTVTSGGTESILLAMKTYRDRAKENKGIAAPEIIAPTSAHAAFTKAGEAFGIKVIRVPVGADFRADVAAMQDEITENTIALVGSAPPFPHGIVDPIDELSELARQHGIGFHTDACLGGFILPWAEKLGYAVPVFDFRLPGVTSISIDTHKYGYAPKGTSVLLYRGSDMRHLQYFSVSDWPGGLYITPTFSGSRPGALIAAAWAALVSIGEQGYLQAAKRILETTAWLKNELADIKEIQILQDPLFMVVFQSETHNVYQISEYMSQKSWSLNELHLPPAVHLCITQRHTQEGVRERFVEDFKSAVEFVQENPQAPSGIEPVYGLAATIDTRTMVKPVLNWFMDLLYRV